ncbi:MAG: Flp pilus assembly protein CpaB [Planctomycetota bacterium]
MKRKAIVPLVLGLGIGLLAVKFAVDAIKKAQASGEARRTINVVQAKEDIAAHEELRAGMVELLETTDTPLTPQNDRIEDLTKALGRVTGKSIPRGSPVLLSMLAPEGTTAGLVGRIPSGFRACSVKIDEVTGVSYQLNPGDWVDVIVVMDVDADVRGKKETVAEVILQHVQVAAVGYGSTAEAEKSASKVKPAKSATLLVPEAEVPKLHLAATRGKVTLAMRGEDDVVTEKPASAREGQIGLSLLENLLKPGAADGKAAEAKKPEPAAMPALPPVAKEPALPAHEVMVFHGFAGTRLTMQIEEITFENAQSQDILMIHKGGPSPSASALRKPQRGPTLPTPKTGTLPTGMNMPSPMPANNDAEADDEG